MDHLQKLIEVAGPSLSSLNGAMPESVRHGAGPMAGELGRLLSMKNVSSLLRVLFMFYPSGRS
jgi:hypothetical protein